MLAARYASIRHISSSASLLHRSVAIREGNIYRSFATTDTNINEEAEQFHHAQSFVKHRFEPPDLECADPDQPRWKSKAKVISAEDFENRPRAGFGDEFDSLYDARVVVSWLDEKMAKGIYGEYCTLMEGMQKSEAVTSHEYVVHVIAQKYNIRAARVAAVVALQHEEEQIRAKGEVELFDDVQAYVDKKAKEHIKAAYEHYEEVAPGVFTEQPYTDLKDFSSKMTPVDDVHDIDTLYKKTQEKELIKAQEAMDKRMYTVDVDEDKKATSMSSKCKTLVDNANNNIEKFGDRYNKRWKYVAHIIDSKEEKRALATLRQGKKSKTKPNTIVSEGDLVRPGTLAEEKQVAWGRWKLRNNSVEYTLRDTKRAWVDKVSKGKHEGWGKINSNS